MVRHEQSTRSGVERQLLADAVEKGLVIIGEQ
jgi:hypothetical protein